VRTSPEMNGGEKWVGAIQRNDLSGEKRGLCARGVGPDISIVVLANNCERYVRKCLRSILAQRGEFTFEVIVQDCGSTDFTMDIIVEELGRQPDLTYRIEPTQVGIHSLSSLERLFSSLRGRFVAFIYGDDEWVRPTKIQDQIDFLERHRECFGSVANYLVRHTATARFYARTVQDDTHSFAGPSLLIRNNLVWSPSSAIFRCEYLRDLKLCAAPLDHLAWVISLQLCSQGILGIQHQVMTLVNALGDRHEAAQREVDRSILLARLRDYDRLTNGAFKEDFQALAGALRSEIARGEDW
jgi:hypothetical protein